MSAWTYIAGRGPANCSDGWPGDRHAYIIFVLQYCDLAAFLSVHPKKNCIFKITIFTTLLIFMTGYAAYNITHVLTDQYCINKSITVCPLTTERLVGPCAYTVLPKEALVN